MTTTEQFKTWLYGQLSEASKIDEAILQSTPTEPLTPIGVFHDFLNRAANYKKGPKP